ncbi:unnamed protein product [Zymoseptoria tritici ST99CH_1A5]|uniref:Uncharacterized protein n=1 Tax=Zymoseptoria tritici ST99CH_1A5 TaxID=1276529 RepID=A0A1Y6LFQ3_ZYMTR|nr:unnamed protein product [Zymoseptoria tritici ST99CH_3D1]SMY23196.1 unnamed protein product [Zymoseptoria tritici ST99CH_1A5]
MAEVVVVALDRKEPLELFMAYWRETSLDVNDDCSIRQLLDADIFSSWLRSFLLQRTTTTARLYILLSSPRSKEHGQQRGSPVVRRMDKTWIASRVAARIFFV